MHPYIVNQTTKLYADEMNRKAEIHRLVAEARRERRADGQLSSRSSHRRPGTVLQRLLPAALTGFTSEKC
jgi:hypothetical protein